ncbi:4699_t:CDS:2 [Gigaspora margarita]|uniref:4699_t:CDS:1 n=1 Tax=Gigaspora margarita TaxID=4874 RepID=A0ABN7VK19_GIGMA|nr:4699_t:CDS:2 [Gigaspora margarita]
MDHEISQSSKSANTEQIIDVKPDSHASIAPHTDGNINKLLISPDEKYAVTWRKEDQSICGWQIKHINEFNHQLYEVDCLIDINELYMDELCKNEPCKDKHCKHLKEPHVIDLRNRDKINKIKLKACQGSPFSDHHLSGCRFYKNENNEDLVIGAQILILKERETLYKVFVFSLKDLNNQVWVAKRSIACGISGEIVAYDITERRKLMILDTYGLLTQWDLDTLSFEKQYQLEWEVYVLEKDLFIFSKEFSLLAVCLQVLCANKLILFVYVYLTENTMILSLIKYEQEKPLLHSGFISSDGGERLLLFFENIVEIRDPYCLKHVIYVEPMSKMCKELSEINKKFPAYIEIQDSEFNVFINEKIYSILDGSLRAQEISKLQWTIYLREKLNDYNKIRSLPSKSQIEKFLSDIIKTHITKDGFIIREPKLFSECSYEGNLVKWNLKEDGKLLQALKLDKITKDWNFVSEWNIHPKHLKQSSKFIYRCEVLGNGDLATITSIGLLIWTIWKEDELIRLRYYKGFPFQASYLYEKDYNNRFVLGTYKSKKVYEKIEIVEFEAKKSNVEKLLEEMQECKKNSLPPPDFDAITQYYDELYMEQRRPFRELLDDYLEDKIIMALYGQELISSFLKNKDYQMMERLYKQCIKINIEAEKETEKETEKEAEKETKKETESETEKETEKKTEKKAEKKTKKETEKEAIDFLVNIKLLEIITYSFMDLTVKFPDLLKEYLSRISLILSSTNKEIAARSFSSKSHLQSHKHYSRPFNIEPFEVPFISDTLKRIAKLDVETTSKKDIDLDKIIEDIRKLKLIESRG